MPSGVVDLPRPGVPADRGLASLGLIMQLVGRTSGALAVLVASIMMFEPQVLHAGWLGLALALCIARSQLHRIAGRDLVYSRRTLDGEVTDPFDALRTYVAFAVGHAIALGLIALAFGAERATAAGIAGALALWPVALAVLLRPQLRAFRGGIPLGEDRGLEGASVVMAILGACGVVSTGALVVVLGTMPSHYLQHGWGVMLTVVFLQLIVRAFLHIRAGLAGLREASFDRPGEVAAQYARAGVLSAIVVGGVLGLLAMAERLGLEAIAGVAVVCWLLAAWPLIIRRFFNSRQFAELLAGDRMLHRRSPDAGLAALGWLLVGHAVVVAATAILAATATPDGPGRMLAAALELSGPLVGSAPLDLGLSAAVAVLELIAAGALLRMTDHRRAIATIYALVAGAVALALAWQQFQAFGRGFLHDIRMTRLIPMAIQLVFPAATLLLVHRRIEPSARARYRTGPDRE